MSSTESDKINRTEGDDSGETSGRELQDPAILVVEGGGGASSSSSSGKKSGDCYHQYSKEKLLQLRDAPLSRQRPHYLDPTHNNAQGLWDPERWHHDWKQSDTSNENGLRGESENHNKRRSGDPRERLRKEQDGIVLSPQRRSFNSGCFVPGAPPSTNRTTGRPDSPLGGGGGNNPPKDHRDLNAGGTRRIGSGRIIARDVLWDYRSADKTDLDSTNEYTFTRGGGGGNSNRKDSDRDRDENRFERRSFGRDFEPRHINRGGGGRYDHRRRISGECKDDEPEWFSGGPTSQTDTIELRGFEDSIDSGERAAAAAAAGRKKTLQHVAVQQQKKRNGGKERPITKCAGELGKKVEEEVGVVVKEQEEPQEEAEEGKKQSGGGKETSFPIGGGNVVPSAPTMDFFEDFLKLDSIPELLTNGVGDDIGSSAGSRFSRWFNKETSPIIVTNDSRRSSLQGEEEQEEDHHLVTNIINGLTDSDTYFAPISPAAATGGGGDAPGSKSVTLLEMLQRGKHNGAGAKQASTDSKNIETLGKVLSLEELEARMRQSGGERPPIQEMNQSQEDMTAFKNLLAQVFDGQAIPASNGPMSGQKQSQPPSIQMQQQAQLQPMSLLQMLNKSQQEDANRAAAVQQQQQQQHLLGPPSPNGPHIPNDLVLKLHQVQQQQQQRQQQQELFAKLMTQSRQQSGAGAGGGAAPFGLTHSESDSGRELLQRPEAVAIVQGLKRGDITAQHLVQQLANPAMQPRHRELLLTILKYTGAAVRGSSPRVVSPVEPLQTQHFYQQQQLRVSPLPPTVQQRIPSPRELQAHTQIIMQRALIKKKLEEQQENFRKKQEQQQQRVQSPTSSQQQQQQSNTAVGSAGGLSSVTARASPLAFTPTSVLRKMTAEKDGESSANLPTTKDLIHKNAGAGTNENKQQQQQGRAVTGMRAQQPQNWNMTSQQQPLKQPIGRPIVKGGGASSNYPQAGSSFMQMQEYQQHMQRQQHVYQQQSQQTRAKLSVAQAQYLQQQQNRIVLPSQQQQQQQNHIRNSLQCLQQMQRGGGNNNWQHFDNRGMGRGIQLGRGEGDGSATGGDLSPTSDQLARWFSPELLAQARAGKLPDMPPASIAQNALSLEELERIQQNTASVHN